MVTKRSSQAAQSQAEKHGFWPPPKSGVHLDEQGQWSYLGTPMENPEINALFTQGLREDPDLGFYVHLFGQNAAITVDRTAWLIVHSHYSRASGRYRVLLLSGDEDDLDLESLCVDGDHRLWCTLSDGRQALFTKSAYQRFVDALEDGHDGTPTLRLGERSVALSSLSART